MNGWVLVVNTITIVLIALSLLIQSRRLEMIGRIVERVEAEVGNITIWSKKGSPVISTQAVDKTLPEGWSKRSLTAGTLYRRVDGFTIEYDGRDSMKVTMPSGTWWTTTPGVHTPESYMDYINRVNPIRRIA